MNNLPYAAPILAKGAPLAPSLSDAKWYAIYTRSRFEKKVYNDLLKSKLNAFLPMVKEYHVWSDRVKAVMVPLLPSYVFVNFRQADVRRLTFFSGVVRVISFEGKPCEIREEEIRLLESIVKHGFQVQNTTMNCAVGDLVRIVRGPMKGWEGRVEILKGQSRVVFQIESIRQAISVEVGVGDLERV